MKILALTAAGVLAASALTPAPAEAQRYGWHDRGNYGGGYYGNRGWRHDRGYRDRGGYGYGGPRYYRGGYGWRERRWERERRWRHHPRWNSYSYQGYYRGW